MYAVCIEYCTKSKYVFNTTFLTDFNLWNSLQELPNHNYGLLKDQCITLCPSTKRFTHSSFSFWASTVGPTNVKTADCRVAYNVPI